MEDMLRPVPQFCPHLGARVAGLVVSSLPDLPGFHVPSDNVLPSQPGSSFMLASALMFLFRLITNIAIGYTFASSKISLLECYIFLQCPVVSRVNIRRRIQLYVKPESGYLLHTNVTFVTHLHETSRMSAEFVFRYGPKCMGGGGHITDSCFIAFITYKIC